MRTTRILLPALAAFLYLSPSLLAQGGLECASAVVVLTGTNMADHTGYVDQWYTYQATINGKVTVSACDLGNPDYDTYVEIYRDTCNADPDRFNDQYCGNLSRLTIPVVQSETLYIRWAGWYTDGIYSWTLTEDTVASGEYCELAIPADTGYNHASHAGNIDQWYSYTTTMNGLLSVSSCGTTSEDTQAEIWFYGCNGFAVASNDDACGLQSSVTTMVYPGQEVLIRWSGYMTSGSYQWLLAERQPVQGETCEDPLVAVEGSNTSDHLYQKDQWYRYTATGDGKVTLTTNSSAYHYAEIYDNCYGELLVYGDSWYNDSLRISWQADPGSNYIIRIYHDTPDMLEWSLTEGAVTPGEFCEVPVTAVAGINTADHGTGDQWFEYTATIDGKIRISTCGLTESQTEAEVYDNCEGNRVEVTDLACWPNTDIVFRAFSGQTYKIRWLDADWGASYTWELSESAIGPGEYCQSAIPAVEGTNTADLIGGIGGWFEYTATIDGKINITNCNDTVLADTYLEVWDSCGGRQLDYSDNDCGLRENLTFGIDSGETYYIHWQDYGYYSVFDWTLTEEPAMPGEFCNVAIPAVKGTNTADHSIGIDQWFRYTATGDGWLNVSTCDSTAENTSVVIWYEGCQREGWQIGYFDDECGLQTHGRVQMEAGVTYYIQWLAEYTAGSYSWSLWEELPPPGTTCQTAVAAAEGTNFADHADYTDQWYTYTPFHNALVTVSTCGLTAENTSVQIYTGDCSDLYWISGGNDECGNQTQATFPASAGNTYYIKWVPWYTDGSYDWVLSVDTGVVEGLTCEFALPAVEGNNTADNTGGNDQWFRYKATQNGVIEVSTCGMTNADTYVEVWADDCSFGEQLGWRDDQCGLQTHFVFSADSGHTYYFLWGVYGPVAVYDWTLTERIPEPGEVCKTALQAEADTNIADHAGEKDQWFRYTASMDGVIELSTCGLTTEDTRLEVWANECNDIWVGSSDDDCDGQTRFVFSSTYGTTYFINWQAWHTGGIYPWVLNERLPVAGEVCETAHPADTGINAADHGTGYDQWFEYTTAMEGVLMVSSCGLTTEDTEVEIWYGCEGGPWVYGDDECGAQSLASLRVNAGETYYIRWLASNTTGSYDWRLTERPLAQGETCEDPIPAVAGINTCDHSGGLSQYFTYTATMNGVIHLTNCGLTNEETNAEVFTGDCYEREYFETVYEQCWPQTGVKFKSTAGETYYIEWNAWDTKGTYDWILEERAEMPGEFCEDAILASEGLNTVDHSGGGERWFRYTATRDVTITVHTCELTTETTMVGVYDACHGNQIAEGSYNCFNQASASFEGVSGQTCYIVWYDNGSSPTYSFELRATDLSLDYLYTPVSAFGGNDGAIDLTISGGMPPYTIIWSNGAGTQDLNGLSAGYYMVTVTDAEGYSARAVIFVHQPGIPGANFGDAPDWSWVRGYGGSGPDDVAGLAIDASGNTYGAGTFSGEISINAGAAISSQGRYDAMIFKLGGSGNLVWSKIIMAEENELSQAADVALDAGGNLFVFGHYNATADFGTNSLTNSSGTSNLWLAKYTGTGFLIWVRDYDLGEDAFARELEYGQDGYLYALSSGSSNITRLDTSGAVIWSAHTDANVTDITLGDSTVYFIGDHKGEADFGDFYHEDFPNRTLFVGALDGSGNFVWVGAPEFDPDDPGWAGTEEDVSYGTAIAVGPGGDLYAIGSSRFRVYFGDDLWVESSDPWKFRGLIFRFTQMGDLVWARNTGSDKNHFDRIAIADTNIYVKGGYSGGLSIDAQSLAEGMSTFIVQLDANGNALDIAGRNHDIGFLTASGQKLYYVAKPDNRVVRSGLDGPGDWQMTVEGNNGGMSVWYHVSVDNAGNTYWNSRVYGKNDLGGVSMEGEANMVAKLDNRGDVIWTSLIHTRGGNPESVTHDMDGNVIAVGIFNDTVTAGPAQLLTATLQGAEYIAKFSPEGNLMWLKHIESDQYFGVSAVVADDAGNVYVTTSFGDSLIVDGTVYQSMGHLDIALVKLSASGEFQWVKIFAGNGQDMVRDMATDGRNLYITGGFLGTPRFGTTTLNGQDNMDVFVAKIAPNGEVIWVRKGGGMRLERAHAVTADKDGYVTISGMAMPGSSHLEFGNVSIMKNPDAYHHFLARFNPDGTTDWITVLESADGWPNYRMGVDPEGNVYTGGDFDDYLRLRDGREFINSGTGNQFVASFTPEGDLRWIKTIEGGNDFTNLLAVCAFGVDNVAVAGRFNNDRTKFDDKELVSSGENTFLAMIYFENKPFISFIKSDVSTPGGFDGMIDLTVTGGKPSYTYEWSNGAFTQDLNFLRAGTYSVTVTDAAGKTAARTIVIEEPAVVTCDINPRFSYETVQDTVIFSNLTTGYEYYWTFGDGTYSTLENPVHVYGTAGIFEVCMVAYDSVNNCSEEVCMEIEVGIIQCNADFGYFYDEADTMTVHFTDLSTGNVSRWYWNFGNGKFSTQKNPDMTYRKPGRYQVCLYTLDTITGCQSEACMEIGIGSVPLRSDFTALVNPDSLKVRFSDRSAGNVTSWYWTFGDGTFSLNRNPVHTYRMADIYEVCLFVSDDQGNFAESCREIRVGEPACNLDANFTFMVSSTGNVVQFADRSLGTPTSWFWDFGDGTTGSRRNPMHAYERSGLYQVRLSVRDTVRGCSDQYIEYIQVGAVECYAGFDFTIIEATSTVRFSDNSSDNVTTWFWSFGDGRYSVEKDPVHQYKRAGLYHVSLTVLDSTGQCMDLKLEEIQLGTVNCNASFTYYIDSLTNMAYFNSEVIGSATDFLWFFGDGSTSTAPDPKHRFTHPGFYSVGLNVFNSENGCMDYHEEIILIGARGIDVVADFIYTGGSDSKDVVFTDRSKGDVTGYIWNFGDGSLTSVVENPEHTYNEGGFYYVCLTAVSSLGITHTTCEFIQVAPGLQDDCLAEFIYRTDSVSTSASFVDVSVGEPDSWFWQFGDNTSAREQNSEHIYDEPGIYLVSLSIANSTTGCTSTYYDLVPVSQGNTGLVADFGYDIDTVVLKAESYPVDYVGVSLGDAQKFKWSFGDGTVDSTNLHPTHVYTIPGTYHVCLEVYNPVTAEGDTTCYEIEVGDVTGLREHAVYEGISVYPNPFNEQANISFRLEADGFVDLSVYDLMGRKVKVLLHVDREAGLHNILLKNDGMESGVYYLILKTPRGRRAEKIILQ